MALSPALGCTYAHALIPYIFDPAVHAPLPCRGSFRMRSSDAHIHARKFSSGRVGPAPRPSFCSQVSLLEGGNQVQSLNETPVAIMLVHSARLERGM